LSQDLMPVRCVTVAKPVGLHTRRDRPFVTVAFHLTIRSVAMQITSRSLTSRVVDAKNAVVAALPTKAMSDTASIPWMRELDR
jgi:hypothetical protein